MSHLRILLIEDEQSMGDLYERLLARMVAAFPGAEIKRADTLREALDILDRLPPDVTVLDLNLLDASAETTIREIASISRKSPVVVVTGLFDARLRSDALRLGAHSFIAKLDLAERPSLLERAVIAAMSAFKNKQREGLSRQIEALRTFALQHAPET